MLNNIIYKPLLFLASGEIEKRTGSRRLDQIRGQHKILPASFASFVIAALAISGIPPLNGFFSKWMIFQGIIACAGQFPRLWVFILLAAMSASALTLASFLKLIASVYLGPEAEGLPGPDQSAGKILMQGPMAAMALACAALGIFGYPLALRGLLEPMLGTRLGMIGFWQPLPATLLLLLGLALGGAFYLLASRIKVREDDRYLLGEESEGMGYSAADFYRTLETDRAWLGRAYQALERGRLDLYDLGRRATFYFSDLARKLHNGSLPGYIAWSIFGMAVLLWVFMQWG
jgi:NADH:ubiquinone oxidoreductase subunit 5 (subunit L)/multisubunit Na+/H+ antiporter MnhA subunit